MVKIAMCQKERLDLADQKPYFENCNIKKDNYRSQFLDGME